ncbi:MAG: hypothetical protein KC636_19545, partial [Myxococcales bacterium]|nr:hypothetical protein [Myxococcales bacterium]
IDNGDVYAQLLVAEGSMASSEGTRLRDRSARAVLAVTAQARAADGMLLDHGRALHFQELPTATAELRAAGEQLVDAVLGELEAIAAAPMLDEDYDGPLLFTGDAAAQLLASTVATEAAGTPAPLADGGRMLELEPHWQDSLGKSVMPEFLDLRDDPSAEGFGRYELDAEGFRAKPITLVERGELRDLLMTRAPNEHLSQSNGRARMSPVLQIAPAISNLTLRSRQPGKSEKALERELLRRAREDGYEFAYVITTLRDGTILGPVPREGAISFASGRKVSLAPPLLIYRIDASGKRTLVRGAVFSPVSLRVLRRIRAVGATTHAVPLRILAGSQGGFGGETGMDGILSHTVDVQVNAPDLLIDGFELLVERGEHERLPTLVHPLRDEGWSAR